MSSSTPPSTTTDSPPGDGKKRLVEAPRVFWPAAIILLLFWLLVALIIGITAIATISVVTGVDKGIKFLSNLNMGVAGLLMLIVLVLGPSMFLMADFVQQMGSYLQNFLSLSFRTLTFEGDAGKDWLSDWTTFYWGWWISWSPFVGVFIARISRGRTVREFVAGVLLVPTLLGCLWFAIFGGSGLHREIFGEKGLIKDGKVSTDLALFQLLDGLPASTLLSVIAIILVVVFFVTSSDSGSFVVDMIASGGDPNPPVWSRVMLASLEGGIAAALILTGGAGGEGLAALQAMAILVALPFSIVLILMAISTGKELVGKHAELVHGRRRRFEKSIRDEIRSEIDAIRHNLKRGSDDGRR